MWHISRIGVACLFFRLLSSHVYEQYNILWDPLMLEEGVLENLKVDNTPHTRISASHVFPPRMYFRLTCSHV